MTATFESVVLITLHLTLMLPTFAIVAWKSSSAVGHPTTCWRLPRRPMGTGRIGHGGIAHTCEQSRRVRKRI